MYEYDIVELNDSHVSHMVHHYDEGYREVIEYVQEKGSIKVHAEYDGDVYWDEY
ncbi:MAG: hypothetical protein AB7S65_08215 [Sulfuricurvum sp.]